MSPEWIAALSAERVFGPAVVLSVGDGKECELVLESDEEEKLVRTARVPDSLGLSLHPGDRALVAGNPGEGWLYVLSVLDFAEPSKARGVSAAGSDGERPRTDPDKAEGEDAVQCEDGTYAQLTEDGRYLRVKDPSGGVVFEYDGRTRRSRIVSGSLLELEAESGIELRSAGRISIEGDELELRARRGVAAIDELDYTGERVKASLRSIRVVASRLEQVVGTAVTRAKNIFTKVEELAQLRSRRRRVLTDDAYFLRCEKAAMRSRRDFKIDGEQIELG